MTSGVSQDNWREAEGCVGGSTPLPAAADQASRAAETRSPNGSAAEGAIWRTKASAALDDDRYIGRQGQALETPDVETPGFHGQGRLTPRLVIQLDI